MIALEQGELCDAELAIKSYWALFSDLIYTKVARLEDGMTSVAGQPDAAGNVYSQITNPTHDVEHEIDFLKRKFIDPRTSNKNSDVYREFDAEACKAFVDPLRAIVPDPKFIPTMIRLYAQDLVPTYDTFTTYAEDWKIILSRYADAKDTGLLRPDEFMLGDITDMGVFQEIDSIIDIRAEQWINKEEKLKKMRKGYN